MVKDKIGDLESVLHVHLNNDNVDYIKTYYRAFYDDPYEYDGDRLCDMILKDLNKTEDPDMMPKKQDSEIMNTIVKYDNLKSAVSVGADTASLYWGWVEGEFIYWKDIDYSAISDVEFSSELSLRDIYEKCNDSDYIALLYGNKGSRYFIKVLKATSCKVLQYLDANDLNDSNDGYEYRGWHKLWKICNENNELLRNEARFTYMSWVSFNNGPNGSKLPILWMNTHSTIPYPPESIMKCLRINLEYYDIRNNGDCNAIIFCKSIYQALSKKFKSVDLPESEDWRYVSNFAIGSRYTFPFVYNRNHIAYNGDIGEVAKMPQLILYALWDFEEATYEIHNLYEYIQGLCKIEDIRIINKTKQEQRSLLNSIDKDIGMIKYNSARYRMRDEVGDKLINPLAEDISDISRMADEYVERTPSNLMLRAAKKSNID